MPDDKRCQAAFLITGSSFNGVDIDIYFRTKVELPEEAIVGVCGWPAPVLKGRVSD
jgi:hypothetical protein